MKLLKRLLVFFGLLALLGFLRNLGCCVGGLDMASVLALLAVWSLAKEIAG